MPLLFCFVCILREHGPPSTDKNRHFKKVAQITENLRYLTFQLIMYGFLEKTSMWPVYLENIVDIEYDFLFFSIQRCAFHPTVSLTLFFCTLFNNSSDMI